MEALRSVGRIGQAIGLVLGGVGVTLLTEALQRAGLSTLWSTALALPPLVVVVLLTEVVFTSAVERYVTIRRWLAGNAFIEGVWLDQSAGGPESTYGITYITYRGGEFQISGREIDHNGRVLNFWHSIMSRFDGSTLEYISHGGSADPSDVKEAYSYVKLPFSRSTLGKPPNRWSGYFVTIDRANRKVYTEGVRVSHEDVPALERGSDLSEILRRYFGRARDALHAPQ